MQPTGSDEDDSTTWHTDKNAAGIAPLETHAVFKCVIGGHATYSASADCHGTPATIPINPGRSEIEGGFSDYELQMLRSADARVARDEAAARAGAVAQPSVISSNRNECGALDQQILALDARARSPISGYEQDLIRADRMRLTSRQFALHC